MVRSLFLFVFLSWYGFAQVSGDQLAFQKILSAEGDSIKLAEIDTFIEEHPLSTMLPNAFALKFQISAHLKMDSVAFYSIRRYLSLMDSSRLAQSLNAVAYDLAQRNYFVDSASVFIDSAIVLHPNEEPVLLNTKALVLLRQKKLKEAELFQRKAISYLPENAVTDERFVSFFVQLGFIQIESDYPLEGMKQIILSNLAFPKRSLPIRAIDSILVSKRISADAVSLVRDSLYRFVIAEYIRSSVDTVLTKSNIAVGLARNFILTELALEYATESYTAAQLRNIEDRSGAAAAMGLTNFYLQRYPDAERYLLEATTYASPTETELFVTLGDVEERLGKKKEAFDSYLVGAMSSRSASVYQKLIALKNELYPTGNLDSIVVARQAAALEFTPSEYRRPKTKLKKNEFPRVVVAELFTGSECNPCQAADVAFDYLIERYNAASIALLEYHLHIPMPDPLSNDDAEKRGEFYNVNSTPTAIFNGRTVITSGGNRLMAKNKFSLYSDFIDRELQVPSTVSLDLSATSSNGLISATVNGRSTVYNKNLKLHLALVEDEVFYKGANGIENHKFVVRKMITPQSGVSFSKKGTVTYRRSISLSAIVQELGEYFTKTDDRFTKLGAGLKEKKNQIDPTRIAIIAFVQDEVTREIFQATTEKVNDEVKKPVKKK